MNLGEKIRSLRQAKLMTQSELAGTKITRNMLSCIENGKSQPSISTIFYLAERLGVSVGFLLAEERDELLYRKMNNFENIKKAFREQNWESCRSLCRSVSEEPDDELCMILAQSDLGIAEETFWSGKLRKACRFFDEALAYAEKTVYPQPQIKAVTGVYFRLMRHISSTLFLENFEEEKESPLVLQTPFARYLDALEAMDEGDLSLAEQFSKEREGQSFFAVHLRVKCHLARREYEEAKALLQGLLNATEPLLNEVELYLVLSDLETVCRETEDYKGAYRYANERIELHEQLLKE